MMKKLRVLFICILVVCILGGCTTNTKFSEYKKGNLEELQNEIIRFHVIANSDSKEDQALKIKVRDKVIPYISEALKKCTSKEEARSLINSKRKEIESIALNEIKEEGYSYAVNTTMNTENFPDKVYGDTLYPQGNYEAFRIIIGSGKGQNWWCVMFPPLCFVDETKDTVKNTENTKENNELEEANKKLVKEDSKDNKVTFKFKFFDFFKFK